MSTIEEWTQIYHDGFARESLMRKVVKTEKTCDWCGNNHHKRLFNYGFERDDRRGVTPQKELFCSIGCMRVFHS